MLRKILYLIIAVFGMALMVALLPAAAVITIAERIIIGIREALWRRKSERIM